MAGLRMAGQASVGAMRWLFIAAWAAGVAATVADLDVILLPAGAVVAAFGVGALRRDTPGGLLARAAGVDVRAIVRAAATLVIVLGAGWMLAGVRALAGG
jgi:hypothetical protein